MMNAASPPSSPPSSPRTRPALRAPAAMYATVSMLAIVLTGCALSGSAGPTRVAKGMLVDPKGMSLYTYASDTAGKSACVAVCAKRSPPLIATAADRPAGDYTIITRDDGSLQWAHKGRPLYTWIKDRKPGDRTGDGVDRLWNLARP
jgi:predicted lipoprotein with Yx(FWY)xxD motif